VHPKCIRRSATVRASGSVIGDKVSIGNSGKDEQVGGWSCEEAY